MGISSKKFNILDIIINIFIIFLVILISSNFINQKENLDIDEIYTYGLANNTFQLQINDYAEYSGSELLKKYAAVTPYNKFDIKNVFFNQENDTHPPLYYLLVNFICSIFTGKFSIWYGLSINIFFLIILVFQMKKLINRLINSKALSTIITLISLFTYGFVNMVVFTRMYVMLSAISLLLINLIIDKIDTIDKKMDIFDKDNIIFLIKYIIINLLGALTQYHFILVSIFFTIYYIIKLTKLNQKKQIATIVASDVISMILMLIIFPSAINHIFGNSSLHSFTQEKANSLFTKFYEIGTTIVTAFFGKMIILYLILLVIPIIILLILKKKPNVNKLYYILFIFSIYYYIIVCLTAQFSFMRYLYNIYPVLIIIIIYPIYILYYTIFAKLKFIPIIALVIFSFSSTYGNAPFSLNYGDSYFEQFLEQNENTKIVLLYRSTDENGEENTMGTTSKWKLPRPIYSFRNMKNLTFVDISNEEKLENSTDKSISNYNDLFLVIYTKENDQQLIKEIMSLNKMNNVQKIYFTDYYHMYRLTQ